MREQLKNHKIMNGIILFLTLALLANAATFAATLAGDIKGVEYEEYSFLSRVERQDYVEMVRMMYSNEAYGVEPTETMKECYAVARYFELASYAVAEEKDGQPEKGAEYETALEELKLQMGQLSYAADEIDTLLENAVQ